MDKCQKWDKKELWRLGRTRRRCVLACYAQIGRGGQGTFCDLPIRRTRACCEHTPGVKGGSFSGDEGEKRETRERERESPALDGEREKPCPGWRRHERRAVVGTDGKIAIEKGPWHMN
ncbi:hypothetical protein TNCV_4185831 [Trichonephila clavipes]|nr:hypothetical protein TNCV_4185831 [Trichonephila clavipes]